MIRLRSVSGPSRAGSNGEGAVRSPAVSLAVLMATIMARRRGGPGRHIGVWGGPTWTRAQPRVPAARSRVKVPDPSRMRTTVSPRSTRVYGLSNRG